MADARSLCTLAPRSVAGDVAIDNHLAGSTLGGELAQKINQFRQLRFREYMDVCQLCKERNVPLSEGLLKKGALGGAPGLASSWVVSLPISF